MQSSSYSNKGRKPAAKAASRPKSQKSGKNPAVAKAAPRRRQRNRIASAPSAGVAFALTPSIFGVPPQSGMQRHESRICARREMVQSVTTGASVGVFAVNQSLPINAGLAQLFPWLSTEANRYEKYRFRRLAFEYLNSVSPLSAAADGNVSMAVDFDTLDPSPTSLAFMNQNEVSRLFSPFDKVRMEISAADLARRGWLYTRSGGVPTGSDAKTYDLGNIIVATVPSQATTAIGNLFVDYEVELDVPQEPPIPGQKLTATAGLTNAALAGTDSVSIGDPILSVDPALPATFTFVVGGEYFVEIRLVGTVLACTAAGSSVNGSATSVEGGNPTCVDAATTHAWYTFFVRANIGDTIAPIINSATTVTSSIVRIFRYRYILG